MTYQGVDTRDHSIHDKHEEHLIVFMADAIIYPNAMVVLYILLTTFSTTPTQNFKG